MVDASGDEKHSYTNHNEMLVLMTVSVSFSNLFVCLSVKRLMSSCKLSANKYYITLSFFVEIFA